MKRTRIVVAILTMLTTLNIYAETTNNSKFKVLINKQNNKYVIGDSSSGGEDVLPAGERMQMDDIFCSPMGLTCYGVKDNNVWAVGDNSKGQLGDGTTINSYKWIKTSTSEDKQLSDVKKISVGNDFALALKTNGEVFVIGGNDRGQLGLGNNTDQNKWVKTNVGQIVDVAAGNGFSYAVDGSVGYLFVTGLNFKGQLGTNDKNSVNSWTFAKTKESNRIKILQGVKRVAAGNYHGIVELKSLQGGRRFMTAGDNTFGQLANNGYRGVSKERSYWDVAINAPQNIKEGEMFSTAYNNYVLDTSGVVWETGFVKSGSKELANFKKANIINVKMMTVNYDGLIVQKNDGSFEARGKNTNGELGFGHYNHEKFWRETALVLKGKNIKKMIGAKTATFMLTSDGLNYSTGSNSEGLQAFDDKKLDKLAVFTEKTTPEKK